MEFFILIIISIFLLIKNTCLEIVEIAINENKFYNTTLSNNRIVDYNYSITFNNYSNNAYLIIIPRINPQNFNNINIDIHINNRLEKLIEPSFKLPNGHRNLSFSIISENEVNISYIIKNNIHYEYQLYDNIYSLNLSLSKYSPNYSNESYLLIPRYFFIEKSKFILEQKIFETFDIYKIYFHRGNQYQYININKIINYLNYTNQEHDIFIFIRKQNKKIEDLIYKYQIIKEEQSYSYQDDNLYNINNYFLYNDELHVNLDLTLITDDFIEIELNDDSLIFLDVDNNYDKLEGKYIFKKTSSFNILVKFLNPIIDNRFTYDFQFNNTKNYPVFVNEYDNFFSIAPNTMIEVTYFIKFSKLYNNTSFYFNQLQFDGYNIIKEVSSKTDINYFKDLNNKDFIQIILPPDYNKISNVLLNVKYYNNYEKELTINFFAIKTSLNNIIFQNNLNYYINIFSNDKIYNNLIVEISYFSHLFIFVKGKFSIEYNWSKENYEQKFSADDFPVLILVRTKKLSQYIVRYDIMYSEENIFFYTLKTKSVFNIIYYHNKNTDFFISKSIFINKLSYKLTNKDSIYKLKEPFPISDPTPMKENLKIFNIQSNINDILLITVYIDSKEKTGVENFIEINSIYDNYQIRTLNEVNLDTINQIVYIANNNPKIKLYINETLIDNVFYKVNSSNSYIQPKLDVQFDNPFYYIFYINFEIEVDKNITKYSNISLIGESYNKKSFLFLLDKNNLKCFIDENSEIDIEINLNDEYISSYNQLELKVFSNFRWITGKSINNGLFRFKMEDLINNDYLFFKSELKNDFINNTVINNINTYCIDEWILFNNKSHSQYVGFNYNRDLKLIYNYTNLTEEHKIMYIAIDNTNNYIVYARKVFVIYDKISTIEAAARIIPNRTNIIIYNGEYLQIFVNMSRHDKNSEYFKISIIEREDESLNIYFIILLTVIAVVLGFSGMIYSCVKLKSQINKSR